MKSTSPPILDKLRTIRAANRRAVRDTASMPGVLGSSGRLFPHFGLNFEPLPYADHPTRDANDDWLFGAPVPTAINDPYAGDEGGRLITEHPNNIGTPKPAMFTPYSLGALVFATSFIWLSADLRAQTVPALMSRLDGR